MARPRLPGAAPVIPTNSLVAAATRYSGAAGRVRDRRRSWQEECYRHYFICGEARYAAHFFGNALSRATLSVAKEGGSARAEAALDDLFNGNQSEMLGAIGMHLTIAGECYLVGRSSTPEEDGVESDHDIWEIVSVLEIKVSGRKWSISYSDDTSDIELADDDVVIRIWTPSPARRMEADSPFRALLPVLQEIESVTLSILAQNTSRLAGAGLLLLPQGITFPPPPAINGQPQEFANDADGFMITLADVMQESYADPGSLASRVPITLLLPPDAIDKVKLLHFWSELDANAIENRTAAIQRFAWGMDLPPEEVLGMGANTGTGGGTSNGVSHWGAWQIEESTIKMHVEPMLDTVKNALVISYLRPITGGMEDIAYDTSSLRLRPDRSGESMELYDRGLVKGEVVIAENGFDAEDMMDDAARKEWLIRKIAQGSATPEQVTAALKLLGIDLPIEQPEVPGDLRETRPDPSLEDHPTRDIPEAAALNGMALLAASEALVFRALEKAGNRVLNAGKRGKDRTSTVPAHEAHLHEQINGTGPELLKDAFTCAPQVLAGLGDPAVVVPALERYCLGLFYEQAPHTRQRLAAELRSLG